MRIRRAPLALSGDQALTRMREGSTLISMSPKHPKDYRWFVVPGGPIKPETADKIKNHPSVVASKDGLWPGHDQTWKMLSFVAATDSPAA
jgi:hypothetical protein